MPVVPSINGSSAYCFGGVFDVEEGQIGIHLFLKTFFVMLSFFKDEENLCGNFFNDFLQLDLERMAWRQVELNGKKDVLKAKKKKNKEDVEEGEENMEVQELESAVETTTISDDGVFKMTVGPAPTSSDCTSPDNESQKNFQPSARMNCGLAIKHGILYLYGG